MKRNAALPSGAVNPRIFTAFLVCAASAFLAMPAFGKPVPDNLGNGLDKLVTNNLIQQGVITAVPSGW
jgi:hypothetical protein